MIRMSRPLMLFHDEISCTRPSEALFAQHSFTMDPSIFR